MAQRTDTDNWKRLGNAVRSRRETLGLTQRAAISAAGITEKTWIEVEKGTRGARQPLTLAAIDRALHWPAGTCRQISEGGRVPNVAVVSEADRDEVRIGELEAERARLSAQLADIAAQIGQLRGKQLH